MDFAGTIGLLRRRWPALVLCLVVGVVGAVWKTSRTPDTYAASARLIVNIPAARNTGEALQGVQLTSQLLKSYAQVATSLTAAERVKRRLGLPDDAATVRSKIFASPEPETLLIDVGARDGDPVRARSIADAAASVFIETVAELEKGRSDPIEARIVDNATRPSTPVSPQPRSNLIAGIVLGTVAGLALALALEALDRSLKTPAQGAHLLEAPMLAVIPRRRDAGSKPLVTIDDPLSQPSEAYRSLRTAIRFVDPDRPLRTLLVTSPSQGEGKTSTVANLAVALAQSGERVVVVDADLRRSRIATIFNVEPAIGVTSVVRKQVAVRDAMQASYENIAVLASGPLPPNPSEILGSQLMATLVDELAGIADIVIFDAPPVLPVTDAVVLATQVDGVLVVVRHGQTQRSLAAETHRRLSGVGAKVIGFVLNATPRSASRDYYEDYRETVTPAFNRRVTDLFAGRRR